MSYSAVDCYKEEDLADVSSDVTVVRRFSDVGNGAFPTVQYIVFVINNYQDN